MTILTSERMKDITALSSAVDINLLQPFIELAEEFHVKEVITEDFYDVILTSIENNTLSGNNLTLVNKYIIPCIAYFAWYEASTSLWMKTENKSIVKKFSENSNSIDGNDFKIYRQSILDKAIMYKSRLSTYLIANKTNFPDYIAASGNLSNSSGFFLNF